MSMNGSFLASTSYSAIVPFEMLHVLNATQSKTPSLPSELFSVIFQHACPTPDVFVQEPTQTPPFHLVLRLVSTSWYEIVQSTPQLWTCIVLPNICAENVDTKGRFLKLCLNNSGCLPLTLSFRFDLGLKGVDWFIAPVVDATLEHSTHRIQALRVLQPPYSWLEKLIPKMSQLATIHINNFHPYLRVSAPHRRLSLPKTANPRRIYISYHLLDFHFECVATSVTHVELHELPVDIITEVLLRCPNLVDFSCLYPTSASKVKNPRTMLTSPLVLNHLSTFTWSTVSGWNRVLFEHIHFPALKRFNLRPDYHLPLNDTTLALSLSRFPKTVTTLELGVIDFSSPRNDLGLEMFLPLTSIIQLRFLHCDDIFVQKAFSVLSHETDRNNILFPKLTSIVIDYRPTEREWGPWMEFGPESGERFVQMLRNRLGLMNEFTLTVESAHLTQHWDNEVWHTLRELKRNGLDLTIIEHGRPMII